MTRKCPTCKSDRCGNHAACARKNTQALGDKLNAAFDILIGKFEEQLGRPVTDTERAICFDEYRRTVLKMAGGAR